MKSIYLSGSCNTIFYVAIYIILHALMVKAKTF